MYELVDMRNKENLAGARRHCLRTS